jgi:hypothetical protein
MQRWPCAGEGLLGCATHLRQSLEPDWAVLHAPSPQAYRDVLTIASPLLKELLLGTGTSELPVGLPAFCHMQSRQLIRSLGMCSSLTGCPSGRNERQLVEMVHTHHSLDTSRMVISAGYSQKATELTLSKCQPANSAESLRNYRVVFISLFTMGIWHKALAKLPSWQATVSPPACWGAGQHHCKRGSRSPAIAQQHTTVMGQSSMSFTLQWSF